MTLRLYLVRESEKARLFENAGTNRQWVPRSVCRSVVKFAKEVGKLQLCEVEIEDWWLTKNPWPAVQKDLF